MKKSIHHLLCLMAIVNIFGCAEDVQVSNDKNSVELLTHDEQVSYARSNLLNLGSEVVNATQEHVFKGLLYGEIERSLMEKQTFCLKL